MRKIEADDLQNMILAPGHIYWQRRSGKRVLIARVGQVIDQKLIAKFIGKSVDLEVEEHFSLSDKVRDEIIGQFDKLRSEHLEFNRVRYAKKILFFIFNKYRGEMAYVDLMFIGLTAFYSFDLELTEELSNVDVRIFQRSTIAGIYSVLLAMAAGYFDYKFLQDIYHLCFLFDCNFTLGQVSYYVIEALEQERVAGQGNKFLQERSVELDEFQRHPEESYRLAKRKFKSFLNNPSLLTLIRYHHEKIDGSGFAQQLNDEDFSDIERILIFVSESLPFSEINFSAEEGKNFLMQNIIMGKGKLYLSPRLAKILEESFVYFEQQAEVAI